jgi:hypothetical protein
MSEYSYGWEKLHTAIHSLTGSSSQKDRLVNAICYSLIHIDPDNDLPAELREDFSGFMVEMTSVNAIGNEGSVRATVDRLDEIGVAGAIEKIISFHDTVCRHMKPF